MIAMKKCAFLFVLSLLVTGMGAVQAQQGTQFPSTAFEQWAVLEHIDFASRQVILGGNLYPMAEGMKWYGLKPEVRPEDQRDKFYKKRVGYKLLGKKGNTTVTGILVLPQ